MRHLRKVGADNLCLIRLHSFKLRRKQWKLRDNFSDAELEYAAKEAKALSERGQEPLKELEVDGRLIPWDRVRRKFTRERNGAWHKYDCPFLRRPFRSSKRSIPQVSLRSGLLEDDVECILLRISTYYPVCLGTESRIRIGERPFVKARSSLIYEIREVLSEGLMLLDGGRAEVGWPMINKACTQVQQAFCKEEVDLLPTLINILCGVRLRNYKELYTHVVEFYCSMSKKILGQQHPVTAILDSWRSADQPWAASELMYRAILNIVDKKKPDKKKPTNLELSVVYSLESDYLTEVSTGRDVSVAQSLAEVKWRERHETLGATHPYTVAMLHKRFLISQQQGLVDEADQISREILILGDHEYEAKGRSFHYVHAVHIGRSYYSQGRYAEAESCFSRAALWVATIVTRAGSYHLLIDKELESLRRIKEMGLFDPLPPGWNLDDQTPNEAEYIRGDAPVDATGYALEVGSEGEDEAMTDA